MTKKNLLPLLILLTPVFCFSQSKNISVVITGGISNNTIKKKIEMNTSDLFSAINTAYLYNKTNLKLDEKYATTNAIEQINNLWDETPFYCTKSSINEQLLSIDSLYQMRNIPCVFGDDEQLDVVINYASDGRVNDFYIGIELHQYKNVLDGKGVVDQTRREIILNFIENLRTAYIKKDIDFIETLYSDNALIITGKVVKKINGNIDYMKNNLTSKQVEYQISTKKEYIERLKSIFSTIPYLKLNFTNIEVTRHKKYPNFYGVLLNQHWATPDYEDNGILFFLIQFRDEEDPLIWVRTWQDAKNTKKEDVFGFYNFKIVTGQFYN